MGYLMIEKDSHDHNNLDCSKEKICKTYDDTITVYYCSLGGCSLSRYEKLCDRFCPYSKYQNIKKDWAKNSYYRQMIVGELELKEEDKNSPIHNFLNNNVESSEHETVMDKLRKLNLSDLREIREFNPGVIDKLIFQIEEENRQYLGKMNKSFVHAKIVGEYVYLKMNYLPEITKKGAFKSYWKVSSYQGNYIKISDIDNHFLNEIERHSGGIGKEASEEYSCKIKLFKDFLEEKLGLITLLALVEK